MDRKFGTILAVIFLIKIFYLSNLVVQCNSTINGNNVVQTIESKLIQNNITRIVHGPSPHHSMPIALKLHIWLMIIGWIGFITSAMLMASGRDLWINYSLLGKQLWFQLHLCLTLIGLICIVLSLIIIFVWKKGWSKTSIHTVVGMIASILAVLQAIGGFCRMSPDHPYRAYFNYFHWFTGNASHILALFIIVLAGRKRSSRFFYLLMSYLFIYFIFNELLRRLNLDQHRPNSAKLSLSIGQQQLLFLLVMTIIISLTIAMTVTVL